MSVMVDWEIKEAIKWGRITILPMAEGAIGSNSVDLRLNNTFAMYGVTSQGVELDPYDEASTKLGLMEVKSDRVLLCKGAFLLAETMERIVLPDDVCATIEGKSSLARLGITIHQTGGWIDAGFGGTITLEMTNENIRPIILRAGMPIAQLVLHQCEKADVPYNKKASAKYNNQVGAVGSRYYKNEKQTTDKMDHQCEDSGGEIGDQDL